MPTTLTPTHRPLDDRGFTLLEVMVVVLVIGILLAVGIPTYLGSRARAQDRAAQTTLRDGLATAAVVYIDHQTFTDADPSGLGEAEPGITWVASPTESTDNLEVSVASTAAGTAWGGAARSDSGTCFYIRTDEAGVTTYGSSDAASCTGAAALTATAGDWSGGAPPGVTGLDSGFSPLLQSNSWNTHSAGQTMDGWEVVSGNVDGNHNNHGPVAIPVAGQFIDLNGGTAGHIRKTVSVAPNTDYTLTMDLAENVWGGPAVKQFEIIWNGVVVDTVDVDLPANTAIVYSISLPGSPSNQAVLEFRSLHGSAHGPLIGNPILS